MLQVIFKKNVLRMRLYMNKSYLGDVNTQKSRNRYTVYVSIHHYTRLTRLHNIIPG